MTTLEKRFIEIALLKMLREKLREDLDSALHGGYFKTVEKLRHELSQVDIQIPDARELFSLLSELNEIPTT